MAFAYAPAMPKEPTSPRGHAFVELVEVMERLLAPEGCPWDQEQTLDSLRPYLLEETYEVIEALESGDAQDHCEELGDLAFQIVFQAALRQRDGDFDVDDVMRSIRDKLVRRHPHVFADATVSDPESVKQQWEEIKAAEKAAKGQGESGTLSGIPTALPALARAQKLSARAARVGFDWPDVAGCRDKVVEELDELDTLNPDAPHSRIEEEVGDLFFAVVSLSRKLGVDAETALRGANRKFERRFGFVEKELARLGKRPVDSSLTEMDALWERAKLVQTD
jgi:MazG family protein